MDLLIVYDYHNCENYKNETNTFSVAYFLMRVPKALVE